MAIFHQLETTIQRGTHTCSMATAAYRSGSKLTLQRRSSGDEIKNYDFDFSTKKGIIYSTIVMPAKLKNITIDRQRLWQVIEDGEKEFDAILARELTIALPEELSIEQNIDLINDYIQTSIIQRGLIADINFHREHANNPHFHVIYPLRSLELNDKGILSVGSINIQWENKAFFEDLRSEIASIINTHLEKNGFPTRISHKPNQNPKYEFFRPWL
jgi:hypothetical protein